MSLPVITIAQMRDWETATWAAGQSQDEVIRQVGRAAGRRALQMTRRGQAILILAGKGHNGADARLARDHLPDRHVQTLDVSDPVADRPRLARLLAEARPLIIDGLFGIGLNRALDQSWARFIEEVNRAGCQVLAVDVPSGLDADTGQPQGAAIKASVTLTVGAPKIGLLQESAWSYVGRLEVAQEVGLVPCNQTSELHWTSSEDFRGYPPGREVATHKGSYGHLAIMAGSPGYHGAAVLAGRSAQRAQPGLITLQTPETVYPVVAPQLQAAMVALWTATAFLNSTYTAFLVGPGLASPELPHAMKHQVDSLWRQAACPVVVDASALAWLSEGSIGGACRVVTPHPGEAGRLLGTSSQQVQADRAGSLRALSKRFGDAWVVLKGHQTLVGRSHGEIYVNGSGNPHLAQGGSGDVLAGYLAGLLAQPLLQADPLQAIRYAVWQHGAAADQLQATQPGWVIEDLCDNLGAIRPEACERRED